MGLPPSLARIVRSIARIARTRYPRFLFGRPLRPGEIPVFVYHDVDPEAFASDLAFLRNNSYRTLSTEEFVQHVAERAGGRAVLLTFDDARRNFWEVAFPLLRHFGACATLFAPTYWVGDGRHGGTAEKDMFMTWDEMRTCRASGLVDVQSHAHRHALVFTSARLVGFASPQALAQYDIYDWPMRRDGEGDVQGRPPLGTPVYEATPLLSASFRVLEDQAAARACQEHVAARGGERFFARPKWAAELRTVHQERAGRASQMGAREFDDLVASEFVLTRRLFQEELGVAPRYLAFPWMLGSARSLALAAEHGIEAVFGVGLDFRRVGRVSRARGFPS